MTVSYIYVFINIKANKFLNADYFM